MNGSQSAHKKRPNLNQVEPFVYMLRLVSRYATTTAPALSGSGVHRLPTDRIPRFRDRGMSDDSIRVNADTNHLPVPHDIQVSRWLGGSRSGKTAVGSID